MSVIFIFKKFCKNIQKISLGTWHSVHFLCCKLYLDYINFLYCCPVCPSCLVNAIQMGMTTCVIWAAINISKMPTVRNARSLVTSRELPSGLQIWRKSPFMPLNTLFSVDADTDSASEESVKVIQGCVAHGTLYVRLTCPTMDNRHNKLSQVPEF